MDSYRGNSVQHEPAYRDAHGDEVAGEDDIAREPPPASVGQDERRMQVRAYNYWASLLGDRPFPRIEDLAGAALPGFADHAVVLDFSQGVANPAVMMLGGKLAQECGATSAITQLSQVPAHSLLSRITDRYRQILANAAPIGFEAEFVDQRGTTLLYRGILLPFSGNGLAITHLMGVINWKELADPIVAAELRHELASARAGSYAPAAGSRLPTWADGPIATDQDIDLAGARAAAEAASAMEARSRAALDMAIGRAWDLALAAQADPEAFRQMAGATGRPKRARAPLAAVVRLVFGATYHPARLNEFALALAHARRIGVGHGHLPEFLARTPGGLKGIIGEERRLRRAAGHIRDWPRVI